MNTWNRRQTPIIGLPTRIDAAGTASQTIDGGSVRSFIVKPETAMSQLRITIDGNTFDCIPGDGWELNSPDGKPFLNDVTLTALAGTFVISVIK